MGLLDFANNVLGTSGLSSNPLTAASQTPGKSVINNVRGIDPTTGTTKQNNQTVQYQVALVQGQPSTTPQTSPPQPPIPLDTYRAGIPETTVFPDGTSSTTLHKYQLDELNDQLASISITTVNVNNFDQQLLGQVQQKNFGGTFQGDIINTYSRFFLDSAVEQQTEKYQVVETFTAFYVFFYGKRPSFYRYSGFLLNDPTHKWTNDMQFFYENYFRGTRTAELSAQAVMSYNGRVVTGFIVGMTVSEQAIANKGVPFSFDFLVLEHIPVYFSADLASLIQKKTTDLRAQADAIASQLASMNQNIPSDKSIIAGQVRNGLLSPSTLQAPSGPDKPIIPQSNIAA